MSIKIKFTEKQLHHLIDTLEIYCRIGTKQLEMIIDKMHGYKLNEVSELYPEIEKIKKRLWNKDLHEGEGICSTEQNYKECYSMMKIIQKFLYSKEKRNDFSTWNDGNILGLNEEPEIEIEDVDNKIKKKDIQSMVKDICQKEIKKVTDFKTFDEFDKYLQENKVHSIDWEDKANCYPVVNSAGEIEWWEPAMSDTPMNFDCNRGCYKKNKG